MQGRGRSIVLLGLGGVAAVTAFVLFGPPKLLARTSTPDYCSSCHVMEAEFEAWAHAGAHRGIKCVDCHLPNANHAVHYFWKSLDGMKDVALFYSGQIADRITISGHGAQVLQANCIRCHESTVAMIDNTRQCWGCHRNLQHRQAGAINIL